ncbi:hypothetical protein ACF0H5_023309 [Mactra antiquata]
MSAKTSLTAWELTSELNNRKRISVSGEGGSKSNNAEVERICDLERRHVAPQHIIETPVVDEEQESQHEPPIPAPAIVDDSQPNTHDARDMLTEALSDTSDDDRRQQPPRRRRSHSLKSRAVQ